MHGLRRVLGSIALVAALGCSDAVSPDDIAGTYILVTVDGETLPTSISIDATAARVESGFYTFNAGGTFTSGYTLSIGSQTTTVPFSGTYSLSGSEIRLTGSIGDNTVSGTGTIDAATFRLQDSGYAWVYERR